MKYFRFKRSDPVREAQLVEPGQAQSEQETTFLEGSHIDPCDSASLIYEAQMQSGGLGEGDKRFLEMNTLVKPAAV